MGVDSVRATFSYIAWSLLSFLVRLRRSGGEGLFFPNVSPTFTRGKVMGKGTGLVLFITHTS